VFAHVELAQDAGLVEASFMSGACALVQRITNDGYDFLEASKQKTLWEQAKGLVIANGLPMTVATIKTVLQTLVTDALAKLHRLRYTAFGRIPSVVLNRD
jgi:formylmethanofuran:tetrahydromethanopterin formyltransferase